LNAEKQSAQALAETFCAIFSRSVRNPKPTSKPPPQRGPQTLFAAARAPQPIRARGGVPESA